MVTFDKLKQGPGTKTYTQVNEPVVCLYFYKYIYP